MIYTCHYASPLGGILLAADGIGLTGLWFDGQKYFARDLPAEHTEQQTPILTEAMRWLDIYFTGREPDFLPPLHPIGSPFRQSVWDILRKILRTDHNLRRNRASACQAAGPAENVRAGGRRSGRSQRNLHHHPLPPCRRHERQPDRLRRRHQQKDSASHARAHRYEPLFHPEERHRTMKKVSRKTADFFFMYAHPLLSAHIFAWF